MICVYGKAGAGVEKVVLPIPLASIMNEDGAGAGVDGSSAPDTASDDETLGPVLIEAVLPILLVGLMY